MNFDQLKQHFQVHLRHHKRPDGGYLTRLAVVDDVVKTVTITEAKCHPNDQFSKEIARSVVVGRFLCQRKNAFKLEYTSPEALRTIVDEYVYKTDSLKDIQPPKVVCSPDFLEAIEKVMEKHGKALSELND